MKPINSERLDRISRRTFLKSSTAALAGFSMPMILPSSVFGATAPSNRITIGSIGTGGMGMSNLKGFKAKSDVQIVAVCDVDTKHLEDARKEANIDQGSAYGDFRKLLERKDIDAVVVCTPDHWHVPISIAALKAGKDVYCEKPQSLTITQGRQLSDTVRRYARVFQTGSQQRSESCFRFGCELVRNGRIGDLKTVYVGIPGNNRTCDPTWKAEPVPENLDYNFWLGQAPWAPYLEQRCHYTFRFMLDYSGGQVTNWGAHHLDIAHWGMGMDNSGPVQITGKGEFPKTGLFTTATKVYFECLYKNGVKLVCQTSDKTGTTFVGTNGWVHVNRGIIDAEPKSLIDSVIKPDEIHLYSSKDHKQNFLDCIKSRRKCIADVEIGHRSATVCHLGNIAMLLGRPLKWDPQKEKFIDDTQADNMLSRQKRTGWAV